MITYLRHFGTSFRYYAFQCQGPLVIHCRSEFVLSALPILNQDLTSTSDSGILCRSSHKCGRDCGLFGIAAFNGKSIFDKHCDRIACNDDVTNPIQI